MSSSHRKSKQELLFKVRFQNPLPPPPFPPKLLHIPTNPSRYATPDFTASLASEMPLPMVVDAEHGMPLDLSAYECLWTDDVDDSQLNPDPNNLPPIDPRDAFMLADPTSTTSTNGIFTSGSAPAAPQVSWLRKTEYISSTVNRTLAATPDSNRRVNEENATVDISREAQIRDIETSFKYANDDFDIETLKHPNKPGVTAVESFEILPDVDIWPNAYDLFRFAERPGERPGDVIDPRLDCAILRPMESDGDHFLAYYLPKEDEIASTFFERRRTGDPEETIFSFVRDYETVKIEQDVPNEFLFVLDEGDDLFGDDNDESKPENGSKKREKGAYYKNIERRIMLKKKRANQWDTYTDKWDAINLSLAPFTTEELDERQEVLAEVVDPLYMFSRADADGEVDDTEVNVEHVTEVTT